MSVATPPARPSRALDDAIRAIPSSWFQPSPAIYWADLVVTASVGWVTFALAAVSSGVWRMLWIVVAALALYRAVLFIHEITHLSKRDVPFFTAAWNAMVGVPLLIPSFLYENVHTDHHRQRSYGTPADPEYLPYGRRSLALLVSTVLASALVPLAFVVRFGVLAPMSWLLPPLRRWVVAHASALVINHRYIRRTALPSGAVIEELACTAVIYVVGWLIWQGRMASTWLVLWLVAGSLVSAINAVRTLAAHRYDIDEGDDVSMVSQLLDSCTVAPTSLPARAAGSIIAGAHMLLAPVGLRYHALHHWIPSLPYHNLGRAHRRLIATLNADAPYHATIHPTAAAAIADLVRRARTPRHGVSS